MEGQEHHLTTKTKKVIMWYLVILAAVIISIWIFGRYPGTPRIISNEFVGQVEKIEGNTVFVKGNFHSDNHPETLKPENRVEVQVTVGSKTTIARTSIMIPTAAELKKTNGLFDSSKLPQQTTNISLADLTTAIKSQQNIMLDILATENIYGRSKFTASKMSYNFFDYSALRASVQK